MELRALLNKKILRMLSKLFQQRIFGPQIFRRLITDELSSHQYPNTKHDRTKEHNTILNRANENNTKFNSANESKQKTTTLNSANQNDAELNSANQNNNT